LVGRLRSGHLIAGGKTLCVLRVTCWPSLLGGHCYFITSNGTKQAHTTNSTNHNQRQRPIPFHAARQGPGNFS
ncbi:MAG: hypothetical protein ACRER5_18770, partial [Pseudomonas sp.]